MQTSIHIEVAKSTCERHNLCNDFRDKLSYVHHDLTHLNEYEQYKTVEDAMKDIERRYRESVGQKMQAKATPIKEGVLVIKKDTTMEQVKDFCAECQKRWGIKPIHIAIHRDEGYPKNEKLNYHAHIVWDFTNEKGKAIKLKPLDCTLMQDIASACLGMERGKASNREHLSALEYKCRQEEERNKILEKKNAELKSQIAKLQTIKVVKSVISSTGNATNAILSIFRNDEKETMKNTIEIQKDEIRQLNAEIGRLKNTVDLFKPYYKKYNGIDEELNTELTKKKAKSFTIQATKNQDRNNGLGM